MNIDVGMAALLLYWTVLSSYSVRKASILFIKEVGINFRHYPSWYFDPPKWMRKFFKLKSRQMIPKFLYGEFYLTIFFCLFGLTNFVLYICQGNNLLSAILLITHVTAVLLDFIYLIVASLIAKKC